MQIYVGSTLTDLAEHRAKALEALSRVLRPYVDFQIVGPENAAIDGTQAIATQLQLIDESSIYLLLLGWRYGYIPEGETRSVVEIEYEAAKQSGCIRLCFIVDDRAPVVGGLVETGENAAALRKFKARVSAENIVRRFSAPDDLALEVVTAVEHWAARLMSQAGQDVVDRPVLERELDSLRRERDRQVATISELRLRLSSIVPAIPIWHTRHFVIDDSLCFCLLPFSDEFMRVYEEGIAPAAEAAGLRSRHAGQIFDNREIMEDIWESICTARIIVADVTNRNPNVFYELGICHTLGKEVLVITQQPQDVPFDIRHRRFIQYSTNKLASLRHDLLHTMQRVLLRNPENTPGA